MQMVQLLRPGLQLLIGLAITSSVLILIMIGITMKNSKSLLPAQARLDRPDREIYAKPKVGANQILFVEASCSGPGTESAVKVLRLDANQACAIESAATSNPFTPIYLYHQCPLDAHSFGRSSQLVKQLFGSFDNLYVWHETTESLFRGTEMEEFYKSSNISSTRNNVIHTSDMLRYFLLWKYGGTYLDLDFIVTRSLLPLADDYVALESEGYANMAALRLQSYGVGHELAALCLSEMREKFTGLVREETGPGLVNRVLKRLCGLEQLRPSSDACHGLVIYPTDVFYAVPWWEWKRFFNETHGVAETLATVDQSYAVHLWRSMMFIELVDEEYKAIDRKGRNHPKAQLAKMYCPLAYHHSKYD